MLTASFFVTPENTSDSSVSCSDPFYARLSLSMLCCWRGQWQALASLVPYRPLAYPSLPTDQAPRPGRPEPPQDELPRLRKPPKNRASIKIIDDAWAASSRTRKQSSRCVGARHGPSPAGSHAYHTLASSSLPSLPAGDLLDVGPPCSKRATAATTRATSGSGAGRRPTRRK